MQLCLDFTLWQTLNTSCIVKSCNQNLTCKVMAAVGFPLFTSLMNFLNSCLENIFWYISNIFNIVYRLFLYLHSLTRRDISSVTWMLLPWILEFFRCERYHSFCTLSIPAFLRTSSLSLNSSKQTKTGLGNKKHENWMTRKLNVRKLELYLKEHWFFVETRCIVQ